MCFTAPTTGVTRVDFSLDGTFRRSDTGAPFDLVGGSSGAATAFDTRTVGDGRHTVRAVIQRAAGAGQTLDSTFTVQNGTPWFIRYSTSPSRSNPIDLDGRTVTGRIYVFVKPDSGVSRVDFYLDGALRRGDSSAPWDFVGGSRAAATSFNTATLARGQHTIRAVVAKPGGGTVGLAARFTAG